MVYLMFIDGDNKYSVRFQQATRNAQSLFDERQPLRVAIAIARVDEMVVVRPVAGSCVVWRVDVDAVDRVFTEYSQKLERMKVLAIDDCVIWPASVS
jgi:hypothetical protein